MALHESDREDLFAEARNLPVRGELACSTGPILLGFRRDGTAAFYWSPDEVYHFNGAGKVRRGFLAGLPGKAEGGRWIGLERRRTATETHLLRRDFSPAEAAELLARLRDRLDDLRRTLAAGTEPSRAFPDPVAWRTAATSWLEKLPAEPRFAAGPT